MEGAATGSYIIDGTRLQVLESLFWWKRGCNRRRGADPRGLNCVGILVLLEVALQRGGERPDPGKLLGVGILVLLEVALQRSPPGDRHGNGPELASLFCWKLPCNQEVLPVADSISALLESLFCWKLPCNRRQG